MRPLRISSACSSSSSREGTVLLDTHTLLWWLGDLPRLTSGARSMIALSPTVLVSAVSIFEIEMKRRIGKLDAPPDVLGAVRAEGFWLQSLSAPAAAAAGTLEWVHRDPFDRLLVAQARELQVPILTEDRRLLDFEPLATAAR
ncbi:type II toxin-antitoxin system VapC family toxin [soil metagenome]